MNGQVYSSYHPDKSLRHIHIACTTQTNSDEPEGYPVLKIGPITIFPSPDQLIQIHHAIGAWLDMEGKQLAGVAEANPTEPASYSGYDRPDFS